MPPTRERVEQFLRCTDREPDEVLGILLPDSRAATIWSIAVNGVMAGCRPEYMPVLVALVEAMADPYYGVEHSGNTPGGETLIILNGPIIKELGFNYTQGVMRDGFLPNTSIGRFWRLYLRNVAGFLPHKNDKATFGNTWRVVVAENEDVVKELGWEPQQRRHGLCGRRQHGHDLALHRRQSHLCRLSGSTPEEMLPYLADGVVEAILVAAHVHCRPGHGHVAAAHPLWADHRAHDCGLGLEQAGLEAVTCSITRACRLTSTSASCGTGR